MASRRERILVAVKAALEQASVTIDGVVHPKPAGLAVHRQRRRPIENDLLPATVLYLLEEDVELETFDGVTGRTASVALEHRVSGDAPEDQLLDPLVTWGTRVLMAEPSLGGLALGVEERKLTWDGEERDEKYGACRQDFAIEYETPENDPEG